MADEETKTVKAKKAKMKKAKVAKVKKAKAPKVEKVLHFEVTAKDGSAYENLEKKGWAPSVYRAIAAKKNGATITDLLEIDARAVVSETEKTATNLMWYVRKLAATGFVKVTEEVA